jgi:tryptophan halogenase
MSDVLFVDRAVTTRVPIADYAQINAYTRCTAQEAGWIWDISLQDRRGVGHVYSSKYTDDAAARAALAHYLGQPESDIETRQLAMRIGFHEQQWRENCVAIGLASGFLEPLESTGIYLVEMANWALLDMIPRYVAGAAPQGRYDAVMHNHYRNIADFLKLHYCLSQRRDTAFWRDNCDPSSIPQTLQKLMDSWRAAVPSLYDFDSKAQCFSETNYKFVLYGMGWADIAAREPGGRQARRDGFTAQMKSQLRDRRERLKQFVIRDTVSTAEYFGALSRL